MKRLIPLLILAVGVVISASFGAQIGDRHADYRIANAAVDVAEDDAARAKAVEARDAIGLPPPAQRVGDWFANGGIGWLFGSALILVGAVIARRQLAEEQRGGDGESDAADFPGTVTAALQVVDELEAQLADLAMDTDAPAAREAIDRLMDEKIGPLVDGRGQLIARHGLATFAEYFGPFSGGERNLARVWSAITDGHAVEARASVIAARNGFQQALEIYQGIEARG